MGKEMKIGWWFRSLAGCICLVALVPVFGSPVETFKHYTEDWLALFYVSLGLPLFLYCAIVGKVPPFLTRNLSDEAFDDYANAHRVFTEFNLKSVVAAIVALIIIVFTLYH